MSTIDLENILAEIASNPPCGDDLVYDPAFQELEDAVKGTPEVQVGQVTKKGHGPNWQQVLKMSLGLFKRSHDLRLAMTIVQALTHTGGWSGFRVGLHLVAGLIDRYWEHLHPLLDAEDHYDPTERLNILESLCDWPTTIGPLMRLPICKSPSAGSINLRQVHLTNGKLKPHDKEEKILVPEDIEAAFRDGDPAQMSRLLKLIDETRKVMAWMESRLEAVIVHPSGNGQPAPHRIDFTALLDLFRDVQDLLTKQMEKHHAFETADASSDHPAEVPVDDQTSDAADLPDDTGNESPPRGRRPNNGNGVRPIHTRQDVVRTLDQICFYYEKNEPASPIPLLLRRAKGLVDKDFFEIMKDLAPDGLKQVQLVSGKVDDS